MVIVWINFSAGHSIILSLIEVERRGRNSSYTKNPTTEAEQIGHSDTQLCNSTYYVIFTF